MTIGFSNARLVCPEAGVRQGSLLVDKGRIAMVGEFDLPEDAERIDCRGATLAPSIIDIGVFAIDPEAFHAGGIARVALMPDQTPVLDDPGIVQRAALIGKPDLWIHPVAAATKGLAGRELAEMAINKAAGARAVGTGRGWIADTQVMRRVLQYAADLDLPVVAHAEDGWLADGAVATASETATRLGLPAVTSLSEPLAIVRDIMLAGPITNARLHFRQVTTKGGLDLIRAAKQRGLPVTCGISPAHLLLSTNALSDFRTFAHLSPPLRSEADRIAARRAVADGTIDLLCSAHDPRGPEQKRLPFTDSAPGAADAEHLLALALTLVNDDLIPIERMIAMLAANPAKLLGISTGTLQVGARADLMLFDADAPWRISADKMVAKSGNTPFDGLPVQGKVRRVFKDGKAVFPTSA